MSGDFCATLTYEQALQVADFVREHMGPDDALTIDAAPTGNVTVSVDLFEWEIEPDGTRDER